MILFHEVVSEVGCVHNTFELQWGGCVTNSTVSRTVWEYRSNHEDRVIRCLLIVRLNEDWNVLQKLNLGMGCDSCRMSLMFLYIINEIKLLIYFNFELSNYSYYLRFVRNRFRPIFLILGYIPPSLGHLHVLSRVQII